jgi:hypothetical protein
MNLVTKNVVIEPEVSCWLGQQVQEEFNRARDARVNTDALLLSCLRQRKGEYEPEEAVNYGSIRTFVNVTSTKCRAGEAWLDDVLASTRERPWTISPTPIPNAPEFVRDAIVQKIKVELTGMGVMPDQAEDYVRERAKDLYQITETVLKEKAQEAADRMGDVIQDQLIDGGFEQAFSDFRSDLITYPYAVLKGPTVRHKRILKWVGASKTPEVVTENKMCVERVSPFDFYWSPWSTSPADGYVVEVMRMEQKALHDCIDLPNFSEEKIREALTKYTSGYQANVQTRTSREALEQNTNYVQTGDTVDVLDYWGTVKGDLLKEWGLSGVEDDDKTYEVNVWVVGDICIRAVLNPDPLGRRPYYVSAYEKVPGSIVGRSVPMLMRPHQEVVNSAYRSLRRNMGLASGPFAEVDQTRLSDGQAPQEIMPGMVKLVEPDLTGGGQPVYRFHQINSHAAELLGVIDKETRACDDATGIPAYSYGNSAASGAGRTVGGLAMLMGNASKGIKKVIGHIERDILEPLIKSMYNYNMLYTDDETIKVDAQVVARGPTGIIMREAMIQRRLEALQLVTPYVQTGVVQPTGVAVLLREVLKGLDMPVDKIIPDPDKAAQLQNAVQEIQQGQVNIRGRGNPQLPFTPENLQGSTPQPAGQGQMAMQVPPVGQGTIPQPVLDGRTGPTQQALASMNQV